MVGHYAFEDCLSILSLVSENHLLKGERQSLLYRTDYDSSIVPFLFSLATTDVTFHPFYVALYWPSVISSH